VGHEGEAGAEELADAFADAVASPENANGSEAGASEPLLLELWRGWQDSNPRPLGS